MKALGIVTFGLCCFLAGTRWTWIADARVYETATEYTDLSRLYAAFMLAAIVQFVILLRRP